LIMVIADHDEYKNLNSINIGNSALYDGRGIIMEDNLHGISHATIGNLNSLSNSTNYII
jgi:UDP-N-acetyl-D-mannosaminuronate dehydrogenase